MTDLGVFAGNIKEKARLLGGAVAFREERSAVWRGGVLAAVVLVPMLVMALLLFVNLDPYGNMTNVPAVVVNQDRGATIDDKQRNVGLELCDLLVETASNPEEGQVKGFSWQFESDRAKADEGLRDGTYFMEIVIPAEFSKAVSLTGAKDASAAQLQVYYNPALGYNVTQAGKALFNKLVETLAACVQKDALENLYITVSETGSDLKTAENTGRDLVEGLEAAGDGAHGLANGAYQLADGVAQLADGLGQLKSGIEESSSAPEVKAMADAIAQVGEALQAYGVAVEASGSPGDPAAVAHLDDAAAAAQRAAAANSAIGNPLVAYLSGGSFSYSSGSATLSSTEKGLIPAIAEYAQAEAALAQFQEDELGPILKAVEKLKEWIDTFSPEAEQYFKDVEAYAKAVAENEQLQADLETALENYRKAVEDFTAGTITEEQLKAAQDALDAIRRQLPDVTAAVERAREQLEYDWSHTDAEGNEVGIRVILQELIDSRDDILSYLDVLTKLQEKVTTLMTLIQNQATAGAAVQGAAGKIEGYLVGVAVVSSYMGESMSQLTEAIATIYSAVAEGVDGNPSLVSGANQLASGANQLADGMYAAADGSNTVFVNVGKAAESLADEGKTEGGAVLNPFALNGEESANVSAATNYGMSMAPFFMGIGLWIGVTLAALVLDPLNRRRIYSEEKPLALVLSGYGPLACVAVGQALLCLLVLQFAFSMPVGNVLAFYGLGIVAALAFAALIQFVCGHFGLGGVVASVLVLAAQIALASGAFPVQTAMPLLGLVSLFLPLTHLVSGLRVVLGGLSVSSIMLSFGVLVLYALVFLGVSAACVMARRAWARHLQAQLGKHGVPRKGGE